MGHLAKQPNRRTKMQCCGEAVAQTSNATHYLVGSSNMTTEVKRWAAQLSNMIKRKTCKFCLLVKNKFFLKISQNSLGNQELVQVTPFSTMAVYLKNFHDSWDICPMGFQYSIRICEISHQTFGPSHRKCWMCPMIFMNTAACMGDFNSCHENCWAFAGLLGRSRIWS